MLRIKESLRYALLIGRDVTQMGLAERIWPDSKKETQKVNVSNLVRGETKKITPETVNIICNYTGVDANFLFNIKPMEK